MSALLLNAFKALGPAATRREIALVATALRDSGDEDGGPLLDHESNPEGWGRCCAIADEAGAYGFVALDLAVRSTTRGLSPGLSAAKPKLKGKAARVPSPV